MAIPKGNDIYRQTLEVPKWIRYTGKFLQFISISLATRYAAKLFMTPFKYKIPKRESHMDQQSRQEKLIVPQNHKEIVVYNYGSGTKKALLIHGWSGRGTQLVKIADMLLDSGYQTISFDAPAHGKASGKTTHMKEFMEAALYLDEKYGPFDIAIGHSLGGMTILNAIKRGLKLRKVVTIGSGDIVTDIMDDFVHKLGLKPEISERMRNYFENQFGERMNDYSASYAAKKVTIPVLVVHDEHDEEVPVSAAIHIHENLKNSQLFTTKNLGHRKILGNGTVIENIHKYITNT
ncbi:alpha/beta hydrolase [Leptobacterium sp. I13]|uniref:alpha/beta fold hydrolase n=1 Tax=Leptobacterium meishanense TaxID=3128904 RepID=UPI0030EC05A6